MASVAQPTTQRRLETFTDQGFHKLDDMEDRPGHYWATQQLKAQS